MNGVPVLSDAADVPYGTDLGVIMVPAAAAVDVVPSSATAVSRRRSSRSAASLSWAPKRHASYRPPRRDRPPHGIRIVGPNTNGVYNATDRIPLGYNYAHSLRLRPGAIGLISHSGAMLGGFLSLLEQFGQGISAFVSCGNEVDLTMDDYCDYLVDDNATHVLALIMDAVSDGARFRRLAERAARSEADRRAQARQLLGRYPSDAGALIATRGIPPPPTKLCSTRRASCPCRRWRHLRWP